MTDILALAGELYRRTEWQRTPDELSQDDYCFMVLEAIKDLLVITGRAVRYDAEKVTHEEGVPVGYADELPLDETEYVLLTAEIAFYRKVQTDVNNIVGYTTDALSVTNADKPFQYISATIRELENRRRVLYYKMTRFSML